MFKMKKSSATRGFACLLILFMLLAGWAIAENAAVADDAAPAEEAAQAGTVEQAAEAPASAATDYMPNMVADSAEVEAAVEEASQQSSDPDISVIQGLKNIALSTGFARANGASMP